MATVTIKKATATEVRNWAIARGFGVGSRGRFSAEVIEAFNKAHRVKAYAEPSTS